MAEVQNGVWVGQEPGWDSPISRGSHCAKGAATRELVHGDRRLRYPMKLVNGQWNKISWDMAINEIGDKMMEIRQKSGAESVYWLGSAKFTNEGSYLNRKFAAYLGNQQLRSPGAHLPFDDGRRRGQYLGLRRDDQQLQRHPQLQDDHLHGQQCRRSASGVAAAHPGRQGTQPREHDRDRSAHDAHGRARHRICAHPLRHRHPGDLGHAASHLQERLGRQGSSSNSASTAWTTSARKSRSGRPRKSSASPACRARSSSASPRCSRPRSRRR